MARRAEGPRRRAREAAFRVAFQADVIGDAPDSVWEARRGEEHLRPDQEELTGDIVRALGTRGAEIDGWIREAAQHWPLERLSATDRAVLRVSTAELLARPGTPARVVLDEAIEVARRYGSEESGGFVNGLLDRIARTVRPAEL